MSKLYQAVETKLVELLSTITVNLQVTFVDARPKECPWSGKVVLVLISLIRWFIQLLPYQLNGNAFDLTPQSTKGHRTLHSSSADSESLL